MIYFCSKCLLVCSNHQTYCLMIPKNFTWTLYQCLYTFSIEMYTSGITVCITATSPCIFLYVHKMSHTKPVPGPVSLQAEAGPGPVMPMPMLPIVLTMLPMRRQWVKPCNHRRKLGPPLWTEFPVNFFTTQRVLIVTHSQQPSPHPLFHASPTFCLHRLLHSATCAAWWPYCCQGLLKQSAAMQ